MSKRHGAIWIVCHWPCAWEKALRDTIRRLEHSITQALRWHISRYLIQFGHTSHQRLLFAKIHYEHFVARCLLRHESEFSRTGTGSRQTEERGKRSERKAESDSGWKGGSLSTERWIREGGKRVRGAGGRTASFGKARIQIMLDGYTNVRSIFPASEPRFVRPDSK